MSGSKAGGRQGAWARALQLAEATPPERNRYVDLLRAFSICLVVFGHWLVAAAQQRGDTFELGHVLDLQPPTQWLTWIFQVMPVFFIVGGFSNGISWRGVRARGGSYGSWLAGRMQRLVGPMVPLLLFWGAVSGGALALGEHPQAVAVGTQMALIPLWFLAVYLFVVLVTPWTHALWERFGLGSFAALAAAAVAIDLLVFRFGQPAAGWANYAFLWLAVHQLGYAWRDRRFRGVARPLALAAAGLAALLWMTQAGPYPLSLVGVPGAPLSNTTPPKLPLLALAAFHGGLLLAIEGPVRRLLERPRVWAAAILVNGTIMTLYLWHLTPMTLLFAGGYWSGGVGFSVTPGSAAWWAWRPLWMVSLAVGLLPFLALFQRFESARPAAAAAPAAVRRVIAALLVTAGLAFLALDGIVFRGWGDLRSYALAMPLLGAWLGGAWPSLGRRRRSAPRS